MILSFALVLNPEQENLKPSIYVIYCKAFTGSRLYTINNMLWFSIEATAKKYALKAENNRHGTGRLVELDADRCTDYSP
jgi:hypothetical protein